jgi:Asp-tRNA(Asn)/Glu-tRNA(Gln) amidotransferase A subunit family amidase
MPTISAIVEAHRSGEVAPEFTIADCYARIRALGDAAVFISLRDEQDALAEARALRAAGNSDRPLFGVPVAVKDNIDVKGLATTAGCPAFAYQPKRDATCVARLKGAIVIGKTNLEMHPVTREIILGGARFSAVDAFAAFHEIAELRRLCERAFHQIDALALPTIPRAYTIDEVLADPMELNNRLGTYTNFVNLLDLCALAVPAAMLPDGVPFGITLIGRAGSDAPIAAIGCRFHADTALPLGATGRAQAPLAPVQEARAG